MLGYARVKEARSPDVTEVRLRELAGDEIFPVRLYTALSPLAPPDVLLRLARDDEDYIQSCVLLNVRTDDAALRILAERERAAAGRRARAGIHSRRGMIVHHPNASEALRAELVRQGACACPRECSVGLWQERIRRS